MIQNRNILRFGIYIFLSVTGFFLLMKMLHLDNSPDLRFLNILFVIGFSNALAKRNVLDNPENDYFEALGSIFAANALAVILSIVGFSIYVTAFDPLFFEHTSGGILWGQNSDLLQANASLFLEGIAGAAITSFILMQYWKDVKIKKPAENQL
jgi:hypothetical protein